MSFFSKTKSFTHENLIKISKPRDFSLEYKAQRAIELQKFLDSPFWKNYLRPYLSERDSHLSREFFEPKNRDDMEKAGLHATFQSGRLAEINDLEYELQKWIEDGFEAQRILLLQAEKKEKQKKI